MAKISLSNTKENVLNKATNMIKDVVDTTISFSPHFESGAPYSKGEFIDNWKLDGHGSSPATKTTIGDKKTKYVQLTSGLTHADIMSNSSLKLYNNVNYAGQVEYFGWKITKEYAPVSKSLFKLLSKYK